MLEPWSYLAAAAGGALIGLLLALFGGGGSVLATPLLIYIVGVRDPHVAIGTSAAAVSLNALVALAGQARAGQVKWPCALVFGGVGLTGSILGAELAKSLDGHRLLLWFAAAMALVGASMLLRKQDEGDPNVRINGALVARLAPLGLMTGLAAGFFGIGGGFLIVPGLMAATGMTLAHAAAASLVSVVLFGAATSASYALAGLVNWPVFASLALGGAVGAVAGLPMAKRLDRHAAATFRSGAIYFAHFARHLWLAWVGV